MPCSGRFAQAQSDGKSVAYSPGFAIDKLSWSAFVAAVKPAGNGNLTFETWPTDAGTFSPTPGLVADVAARQARRFQPSLLNAAHAPAGLRAQLEAGGIPVDCGAPGNPASGNFPTPSAANPPANCIAEEVRRNPSAYNYIKTNRLDTSAGLAAAFMQAAPIAFPNDAVEIKIDWIPVPTLIQFLKNNGVTATPDVVAQNYFVTRQDNTQYAMASVHISTKESSSWLWATFEHKWNPGRCDTMGCYDAYGVPPPLTSIPPAATSNTQYPACPKSRNLPPCWGTGDLPGSMAELLPEVDPDRFRFDPTGDPRPSGPEWRQHRRADSRRCANRTVLLHHLPCLRGLQQRR